MKNDKIDFVAVIRAAKAEYAKKRRGESNRFDELVKLIALNSDSSELSKSFAEFCASLIKEDAAQPEDQTRLALLAYQLGGVDGLPLNWSEALEIVVNEEIFNCEETMTAVLSGAVNSNKVSSEGISRLIEKMAALDYVDGLVIALPRTVPEYAAIVDQYLAGLSVKRSINEKGAEVLDKIIEDAKDVDDEDYLTKLKNAVFETGNSAMIAKLIGVSGIDNGEVLAHINSIDVLEEIAQTNYGLEPDERRELHNQILERMLEVREPEKKNFESCLVCCVYADPEKFAGLITNAQNAKKVIKIILAAKRELKEKAELMAPYAEIFAEKGTEEENLFFIESYLSAAKKVDFKLITPNIEAINDPSLALQLAEKLITECGVSVTNPKLEQKAAIEHLIETVIAYGSEEDNFKMAMIDGRYIEHARAIKTPGLLKKLAQMAANRGDERAFEFLVEYANALAGEQGLGKGQVR